MKTRMIRRLIVGGMAIALLFSTVAVFGQQVNASRHPNLAAAQDFISRAIDKVSAAQHANGFDMGGHAAKAKDLLQQAYHEIGLAAQAANH